MAGLNWKKNENQVMYVLLESIIDRTKCAANTKQSFCLLTPKYLLSAKMTTIGCIEMNILPLSFEIIVWNNFICIPY